ncbi:MAG: type I secretion system permease/ATPase [Alphaproteobacteria bacterium]|nr:type I secretion system permease/ATPase [Alphaproteobacteria bacterium]
MQPRRPVTVHSLLKACYTAFAACGVFSFFVNLLMLTMPLFMFQVFDRVLASRSEATLLLLLLMATVALSVQAALDAIRGFAFVRVSRWIDRRIAPLLLAAVVVNALDRSKVVSSNPLRQLSTLRTFLTGPGMLTMLDLPWVPVFMLVILYVNAPMGYAAIAGALVMATLGVVNDRLTRPALADAQNYSAKAYQAADAAVRNAAVVESMGMRQAILRRYRTENDAVLALQSQASDRAAMFLAISKSARMLIQMIIMTVAAIQIIDPETPMTPGMMIASVLILGRALQPIEMGVSQARNMIEALHAYRAVEDTLRTAQDQIERMRLPAPEGRLQVENVFYQPPGLNKPILQRIGFELEPGESLGIVGPSAAGKSTLARLLVGVERPTIGNVRLDGADMFSWDNEDLGGYVGFMPQDVELFSGTVAENIARLDDDPNPDDVVRAAKMAGLHEMLLRLPAGYDTEIGWAGQILSGGQRQRVALARALYGDPKLVILDEPNANLDSQGDTALIHAIQALKQANVTLVLITHRPQTLALMDKILVLQNGMVQRFGPREETLSFLQQGRREAVEGGREALPPPQDGDPKSGEPGPRPTPPPTPMSAPSAVAPEATPTPGTAPAVEVMRATYEPPVVEDAEPEAPRGPRGRGAVVRPPGPFKVTATPLQVHSVRAISAKDDKD